MTYYANKIERFKNYLFANKAQFEAIKRTRTYIKQNFEKDLNLNTLAKVGFVSKFHLVRLFKKYYGQTPKQFLIERRIQMSKKLLRKGLSVTQTCHTVGFKSLGSFSSLFKQKTGMTPSEYTRKQVSKLKYSFSD